MFLEDGVYSVYVKTNSDGYVTAVNSSAFLADTAGWRKIDDGSSDRYLHAQRNYFPESILAAHGAYRYKLTDSGVAACTEEELADQEKTETCSDKSLEERISMLEKSAEEIKKAIAAVLSRTE